MASPNAAKENTEKKFRGTRGGWAVAALFAIVACGVAMISGCAGIPSTSNASPAPQEAIQITPSNITFSNVTVGQKATQSATVTNTGSDGVTITQVAASSTQFSAAGMTLPLTLGPGQSAPLQIVFKREKTGNITGTLSVTTSHGGSATKVSLNAAAPNAPSTLSLSATSLNFGNVLTTGSSTQNLTLSNNGQSDIHVSQIGATGSGYSVSGVATPVTVPAGQSTALQVKFSPVAAGAATGSVAITSDAQNATANVTLNGTGMAANYTMSLSPSNVAFGNVTAGSSAAQNVIVSNTGNSSVVVTNVAVSGAGVSVTGVKLPVTIAPSQSVTVSVKYAPTTGGATSGSLTVTNSEGVNAVAAISGTGVQAGLSVSPANLSFGSVGTGKSASQMIQLKNSGLANLTITQATASGTGFSVSGITLPLTLTPGQSASFSAQYAPQTVGNATGSILIVSNAPNSPASIALSGSGVQAGLSVTPGSLSFGSVGTGKSATQTIQLTNSGSASLTVSQVAATGTGFSVGGITLPLAIAPGQSASFSAQYAPQAVGNATGSVSIVSNAPNSPATVALSGSGVQAGLSVTPGSLSFGSVGTGKSATQTIQLTNSGSASLTVSQVAATGTGFSVGGITLPLAIAPGQSASFSAQYAPQAVGNATGSVSIVSNAPNSPATVTLSGSGVQAGLSLTPSTATFGTVVTGNTNSQTIQLTNSGTASLTVSQATVTGSGFSLSGLNLPLTLAAGQSLTFNIQYAPTAAGNVTGSVSIASNAPNSPATIALSATAVAATRTISVNPTSLSFGSITNGNSAVQSFAVTNTGNSSVAISGVSLTGTGYSIVSGAGAVTLAPNQGTFVNIQFAPTAAGAANGSVNITSNATGSASSVSLSGTGAAPAVQHTVALNWGASTSTVAGYNVYRSQVSGNAYVKINSSLIGGMSYSDGNVQSGQTYFYVATAIDASGNESVYSNETSSVIP